MDTKFACTAKRLLLSLLLAAGLGGCVYAPYPGYPYYYYYDYPQPAYVGPPVSLNLGFGYYHHGGGHYRGHRGGYRGHGAGGWGHRGGGRGR
jgi:hypothetical protein